MNYHISIDSERRFVYISNSKDELPPDGQISSIARPEENLGSVIGFYADLGYEVEVYIHILGQREEL